MKIDITIYKEAVTSLHFIGFGGRSGFYAKAGWWPHVQAIFKDTFRKVPLAYVGQALYQGKVGYLFDGSEGLMVSDHEGNYFMVDVLNVPEELNENFDFTPAVTFILEGDFNCPPWIMKEKLPGSYSGVYLQGKPYRKHTDKMITPNNGLPLFDQPHEISPFVESGYNSFFMNVPSLITGFREIASGEYVIDSMGGVSYSLYHNDCLEFIAKFNEAA